MSMRVILVAALFVVGCGGGSDEAPGRGEFEACADDPADTCEKTCNIAIERWSSEDEPFDPEASCVAFDAEGNERNCSGVGTVDGFSGCCASPAGDDGVYWFECAGGE